MIYRAISGANPLLKTGTPWSPLAFSANRNQGAKHSWWINPARNRRSSMPRHTEVNDFLARKICRDLDVLEP